MQTLQVSLAVQIPNEYVLVKKVEYENLQQQQLVGRCWTIEDLERQTGRGQKWLRENLLFVPKFKKQLEKFVHYPNTQGEKWAFQASKMAQFIEDNFHYIFGKGKASK